MSLAIGKDWWLPPDYAIHGHHIDALFQWFFWITLTAFISVELLLIALIINYRARPGRTRATHLHGNTRLELIWTLIPTLILVGMAVASEQVWKNFRGSSDLRDPDRTRILVIGQQFKWNVIYPGRDGKFGRYLLYPKPTDLTWPVGPNGKPTRFENATGPAMLPYKQAISAIATYIATENPLGKDFSDPNGKDDDWSFAAGRPIFVPVNRPVEVQLESEDVIHDFFIPNFRAQLYAVPGMLGSFVFTPTITTAEIESGSKQNLSIDELVGCLKDPANQNLVIDIDATSPGAQHDEYGWRYSAGKTKKSPSIIRDQSGFGPGVPEKLKAAGIERVTVHLHQPFEIACAHLCGAQHYTMRGELIVLSQQEFDRRFPAAPHVKP